MKVLILFLTLLLLAGIYLLSRAAPPNHRPTGSGRVKLVITVKDQEPWVEGFVRKLFFCVKNKPGLDVVIVDDFSWDRTPDILKRLARVYPLTVLSVGESDRSNTSGSCVFGAQESGFAGVLHFDVRGLSGKALLDAPLFCHLSHLNEGKLPVLSK